MKRNALYSPVFFAVMAALSVVLFVVNVIHGTWLSLISTGGVAVLIGYRAVVRRAPHEPAIDRQHNTDRCSKPSGQRCCG